MIKRVLLSTTRPLSANQVHRLRRRAIAARIVRFPCRLIFWRRLGEIIIVAVAHLRLPLYWQERLGERTLSQRRERC